MDEHNVRTGIPGLTTFVDFSGGIMVSKEYYDPIGIGVMEFKRGKEASLHILGCTVQSLEGLIGKCRELRQLIAEAVKKTRKAKVVPATPLCSATHLTDAVDIANTTAILSEGEKELLGYSGPHFGKCHAHFDLEQVVLLPSICEYWSSDDSTQWIVEGRLSFNSQGAFVVMTSLNPAQLDILEEECGRFKLKMMGAE